MFKKLLALLPAPPANALLRKLETAQEMEERTKYDEQLAWEEEKNQALQFAAHLSLYFDLIPERSFFTPGLDLALKKVYHCFYNFDEYTSELSLCLTEGGDIILLVSDHEHERQPQVMKWSRENIEKYNKRIIRGLPSVWTEQIDHLSHGEVADKLHKIAKTIASKSLKGQEQVKKRQSAIQERSRFFK